MRNDWQERIKDFFICKFRVMESFTNSLNRSKIIAGIFTVTLHAISRPTWTRGERQKFVDVSVPVTFAPRSNINLVIQDTSLGKCPTVDPFLDSVLISKTSNALSRSR